MEATLETAVDLCCMLEPLAAELSLHVALTGGCLYKEGQRKDIDIVLYSHDPDDQPSLASFLWLAYKRYGVLLLDGNGSRVRKCVWRGLAIDFIIPESDGSYLTQHPLSLGGKTPQAVPARPDEFHYRRPPREDELGPLCSPMMEDANSLSGLPEIDERNMPF